MRDADRTDLVVAACIGSAAILLGCSWYWYGEILDTIELLRMAYGS